MIIIDYWNDSYIISISTHWKLRGRLFSTSLEAMCLVQDDVTLAKLYDSVGSCYDEMGRPGSGGGNVEVKDRTWIDTKYKAR